MREKIRITEYKYENSVDMRNIRNEIMQEWMHVRRVEWECMQARRERQVEDRSGWRASLNVRDGYIKAIECRVSVGVQVGGMSGRRRVQCVRVAVELVDLALGAADVPDVDAGVEAARVEHRARRLPGERAHRPVVALERADQLHRAGRCRRLRRRGRAPALDAAFGSCRCRMRISPAYDLPIDIDHYER